MVFGTTLDGLATRNTVGSERDALETQHCEPRRPLSWPLSGELSTEDRDRMPIRLPSFPSRLSSRVMLYFSQPTHSLL